MVFGVNPTGGSGEMNMRIPFKVTPEGMKRCKQANQQRFGFSDRSDTQSGHGRKFIEQVAVKVKESPKGIGHSESNMLPSSFRKRIHLLLNPGTGGFFAATGAKSALAGEKDMLCMGTAFIGTGIEGRAPKVHAAAEHFDDIIHDHRANRLFMFFIIIPPATACL